MKDFLKVNLEVDEINLLEYMRLNQIRRSSLVDEIIAVIRDDFESTLDSFGIEKESDR